MTDNLNAPLLEEGLVPIRPQSITEQQFRRQQSDLNGRLRRTAFPRTTWILAFVGVFLICLTLFKIPTIDGGYPIVLTNEVVYVFGAGSVVGILLNLLVFLIQFLSWMNERKLNKSECPSVELIGECIQKQTKIIGAINEADRWSSVLSSIYCIYAFLVSAPSILVPRANINASSSGGYYILLTSIMITSLKRFIVEEFAASWMYYSDDTITDSSVMSGYLRRWLWQCVCGILVECT